MKKLVKNCFVCTICETELTSHHRHDFKTCFCGNLMVDGGLHYVKVTGDPKKYIDMCEYIETDHR